MDAITPERLAEIEQMAQQAKEPHNHVEDGTSNRPCRPCLAQSFLNLISLADLLTALQEAQQHNEELKKGYVELRRSMRNEFAAFGIPSNPAWSDNDFAWAITKIGRERDALQRRVEALKEVLNLTRIGIIAEADRDDNDFMCPICETARPAHSQACLLGKVEAVLRCEGAG